MSEESLDQIREIHHQNQASRPSFPAKRWTNPSGRRGGWVAVEASVHPSARISENAVIEPGCVVGCDAAVGTGAWVTSGTMLREAVKVGDYTRLGESVVLGQGVVVGGDCEIGHDVIINWFARIGRDSSIGYGSFIGDHARLGRNVAVGSAVTIRSWARVRSGAELFDRSSIPDRTTVGKPRPCHYDQISCPGIIRIPLKHTALSLFQDGTVESGCERARLATLSAARVSQLCEKAGYSGEVTQQYVAAVGWLKEGVDRGVLSSLFFNHVILPGDKPSGKKAKPRSTKTAVRKKRPAKRRRARAKK